MQSKEQVYLTTQDLMERWRCSYQTANRFMHRKGSDAIKPMRRLLVPLKEVIKHEQHSTAKTGR